MKPSIQPQRGGVIILFALCLPVLLGMLGLALDASMAYLIKAKLSASADAAVLAAGEAIALGANRAEQEANARAAATRLFQANFPADFLGATVNLEFINIRWNTATITIDVVAQAMHATTLGRLLGPGQLQVRAAPQVIVTRALEDSGATDVALVIDSSLSLVNDMDAVKDGAKNYASQFDPTLDRVALVQFGDNTLAPEGNVSVEVAFKTSGRGFDLNKVKQKVDRLQPTGGTPTASAFKQAHQQLKHIKDRKNMQYVMIFTDGKPSWTLPGSSLSPELTTEEFAAQQALAQAEDLRADGFPIYVIGFNLQTSEKTTDKEAIKQLHCWANTDMAPADCQRPAQPKGKVCLSSTLIELSACFKQSKPEKKSTLILTE